MSTTIKPQQPANPAPRPVTTTRTTKTVIKRDMPFLFDKENYMWMIGGIVLILLGFVLLAGGKSANPHEFHYDEIYSVRRITIAPIVLMLGFIVEVYAIMKKPKETVEETQQL
jgi:hypothetical protein